MRVLLGLLKGGVVGLGLGFAAFKLGIASGLLAYLVYGAVGFLVGVVAGKPIWRQETLWTPVLKGVVGFLIALGLTWLARKGLGGAKLELATGLGAPDVPLVDVPFLLAPVIGILYGIFVEVDDGGKSGPAAAAASASGSSVPPDKPAAKPAK